MSYTPRTLYRHFHVPEMATVIPSVTICVEQDDVHPHIWAIGWAICTPEDNFARHFGRQIAREAINARGYSFSHADSFDSHDEDQLPSTVEISEHHPIDVGLSMLMLSPTMKKDYNVRQLREALMSCMTEEKTYEIRDIGATSHTIVTGRNGKPIFV